MPPHIRGLHLRRHGTAVPSCSLEVEPLGPVVTSRLTPRGGGTAFQQRKVSKSTRLLKKRAHWCVSEGSDQPQQGLLFSHLESWEPRDTVHAWFPLVSFLSQLPIDTRKTLGSWQSWKTPDELVTLAVSSFTCSEGERDVCIKWDLGGDRGGGLMGDDHVG